MTPSQSAKAFFNFSSSSSCVSTTVVVAFTSLNLCGDRVTTTASTPNSSARARIPLP
jgi:hypothetical protein